MFYPNQLGLLFGLLSISAAAVNADTAATFRMKVSEPVMVGTTLLPPGTHIWKLLESRSDRHIVQITDGVSHRVEATILAVPNYRETVTDKSSIQFWETPEGAPRAVRAWFAPGENFGQEFPYSPQMALYRPTPQLALTPRDQAPQPATKALPTLPARPKTPVSAAAATNKKTAASPGSWAVISSGAATAPKRSNQPAGGIWQTLKNLPLTATLAPLVGLIGVGLLVLAGLSHTRRKKSELVS